MFPKIGRIEKLISPIPFNTQFLYLSSHSFIKAIKSNNQKKHKKQQK